MHIKIITYLNQTYYNIHIMIIMIHNLYLLIDSYFYISCNIKYILLLLSLGIFMVGTFFIPLHISLLPSELE